MKSVMNGVIPYHTAHI